MGVVMPNVRNRLLAISVLMCWVADAQAQSRPAVVELFTSEGCSSCPPAEAYIGELAQHKDVLALAFHVDYWDDLGWKDPFSLKISTDRQSAYSTVFGRSVRIVGTLVGHWRWPGPECHCGYHSIRKTWWLS
jgi:hypothetical protein